MTVDVRPLPLRKALFLDRDGVINIDHGYVHRPDQVEFCSGIFDLVRQARERGYAVVVVTNQAGIGRGYYTEADFQALSTWMLAQFAERGAPIDRIYHCPDHPQHGVGPYRRESPWRKPNPGMLLQAAADLGLSLPDSLLVGDSASDIAAGRRAGLRQSILFRDSATTSLDTDGASFSATARVEYLADVLRYLS